MKTCCLWFFTCTVLATLSFLLFGPDAEDHPESLEITLGGNPFMCDWRMCWVKQAEQDEWLQYTVYLQQDLRPQCENFPGESWNDINMDCDVADELEKASGTRRLINEILNDILVVAA